MPVLDTAIHTVVPVTSTTPVVRVTGLTPGTLYAVYLVGSNSLRNTGAIAPGSGGPGAALISATSLTTDSQALVSDFVTATNGSAYPAGFFIAGASANVSKSAPTWTIDYNASTDTCVVIKVAIPDFNAPVLTGLDCIIMQVSRDGGSTYGEVQTVYTPFSDDLNYAVFKLDVPYEKQVRAIFHGKFKDGSYGKYGDTCLLTGITAPTTNSLTPPVMETPVGVFVYDSVTNSIQLHISAEVMADPSSDQVLLSVVKDGSVVATSVLNLTSTTNKLSHTLTVTGLDASASTYTVNAYSMLYGVPSSPATATFATASVTPYQCAQFSPTDITLEEVILSGSRKPAIYITYPVTKSQPTANIYLRRRDTYGGNLAAYEGFTYQGTSANGKFTTAEVSNGSTVQYDVVVCAVGINGVEATITASCIKTITINEWDSYIPLNQGTPTVSVMSENSLSITGTYTPPSLTPVPVALLAYKSETDTAASSLVLRTAFHQAASGAYNYQLDVPDLKGLFASGTTGTFYITLRTLLENGVMSTSATKLVVKVVQSTPGAPTLSSATAYVQTVKVAVTGVAGFTSSSGTYTPSSGGSGTLISITMPAKTLVVELSDSGATPGVNPEYFTPVLEVSGSSAFATVTAANYAGTHNCRAKWATVIGDSAWSSAVGVTFASATVKDTTAPALSNCVPRFVCNSDGSITINWSAATFGTSGLGSYVIRRSSTNSVASSVQVGTVTSTTVLSWTDYIDSNRVGTTFYYWLDAVSGQGVSSGSPVAVKLYESGVTYANETTVAAVSTDSAPATPTGLVVKGAQGGFDVTWNTNSERDLKDYALEFSALGTFADTVTYYIAGTSYFQSTGATASSTVAAVYRWRLKSRDFGSNTSAACTAVAADLTNYGSVQDTAPNAPQAVTLTNNADGSISLALTAASSNAGSFYRIIRRYKTSAGWVDTDAAAVVDTEFLIPTSATVYRDSGLRAGRYYNYRVYSRSKLGTESSSYVAATSPVAATDSTAPAAPTISVSASYGVTTVVVTPAEANGSVELWQCSGSTWTEASAVKLNSSPGSALAATPISFEIAELDSANPVTKTYAARQVDSWGNSSAFSSTITATALNWLRAGLIETENLAAGSITTEKLAVGVVERTSLVVNGHFGSTGVFGDSIGGWTLGAGVGFVSQGQNYTLKDGTVFKVPVFSLTATTGVLAEQTILVMPGESYTVVGVVYNNCNPAASPYPTVSLRLRNADGSTRFSSATSNASAGTTIPTIYQGGGITAAQTNNADTTATTLGWQLIAYKITVPVGVTQLQLQWALESNTSGTTALISPTFTQMYVDNEETTSVQVANQLEAVAFAGDVTGPYNNTEVHNSDKLDGKHGSYYLALALALG